METKEILNITQENLAEAEFMSANFIDKEIKNRAFINTLGAEVAITHLSNNGIDVETLRNMHSIKRVLQKTNLADIILPNIHIDVRVVFDNNYIFIPKSHFELNIEPDIYMVLKFNENFENIDFIGYIKPENINKENCNNEFYFVNESELISSDSFIDFVKEFDGNYTKEISDSEMLKGRELAILASDDDITDSEYKEFLNLLKSSSILRDAILEYDNFETLAGKVANFMHDSSYVPEEEANEDINDSENETEVSGNFGISDEQDPNGDSLIDDDEFNVTDLENSEDLLAENVSDLGGVSDEAIELAGLSGEITAEPQTEAPEPAGNMDIGTADFNLEESTQDNDDMNVDLFDSIDSSESDFSIDSNFSEIESGFSQSADDIEFNQVNFEENTTQPNFESDTQEETNQATETQEEETESLTENEPELGELEINADDLSGWDDSENNEEADQLLELPTEGVSDFGEESLSLEHDDLLDENLDLSENDLLSFDDNTEEHHEDNNIQEEVFGEEANNSIPDLTGEDISDIQAFESSNTEVSSFEHYDPIADEQSSNIGVTGVERDEQYEESFNFSDLETKEDTVPLEDSEQINEEQENTESTDDLYDFEAFAEITEEPGVQDEAVDVNRYDENLTDISNIDSSEGNAEISGNQDEVIITDDILNNSVVIENSVIISDKDFEPGEILLDINKSSLPDFDDNDELGDLYNENNEHASGLNNGVRIGSRMPAISPKFGILGLFLIIITAGIILFSVSKGFNKKEPKPVTGTLNPETKIDEQETDTPLTIDTENVVMNDKDGDITTAALPKARKKNIEQETTDTQYHTTQPIPPTSFITVKKLSWEVPDYISYSAEFRQFFQSSGKALRTALSSDLLLAKDYTYTNQMKLSVTFDKGGKFTDAKIVSSSGSANVDKIVLQSVNQTLKLLKAPNSLDNDENTTIILKIYL